MMVSPLSRSRRSSAKSRSVSAALRAEFGSSMMMIVGLLLQRARDLDELLLRDGETTDLGVRIEIDAHLGQDAPRRRHHLALVEQSRSAGRFPVGEDVASHRQVGKEIQLLEDDADAELPGLQGIADDHRFAAQDERAAVRLIDAGQHLHDRRLAGAVLPDDRVDLAAGRCRTTRR